MDPPSLIHAGRFLQAGGVVGNAGEESRKILEQLYPVEGRDPELQPGGYLDPNSNPMVISTIGLFLM